MKILIIDNYDSFTYNLVQLTGKFTSEIYVHRNDKFSIEEINELNPTHIMISPGPGKPEDSKLSLEVIKHFGGKKPILGVCLGHQAIGITFGAKVTHCPYVLHGKTSQLSHDNKTLYSGLPQNFLVGRYHSLSIDESTLPKELVITSRSEDGVIMGIRHSELPIEGMQYHPESILTEYGDRLIKNWIDYYA